MSTPTLIDPPSIRSEAAHDASIEIARLEAQLQLQRAVIRSQSAALEAQRDTFERASEAARIGLWECSLPDERLTWTGVVYDLFDVPRGSELRRSNILDSYRPDSRNLLTNIRRDAIARGDGFSVDAEIVTPSGSRRILHVTATVDTVRGRPVRLFGLKRDVTDEVLQRERLRDLAQTDPLTGLANRARFDERMRAPVGTMFLIDLDGFKGVNDTYGHATGDACLKECGARIARFCRKADLVARLGGDEFVILIEPRLGDAEVAGFAGRIVDALARPIESGGHTFRIGASVGVARGPERPGRLFEQADTALYAAKAAGRNTYRICENAKIS